MANIPNLPSTEQIPPGPLGWLKGWLDTMRLWVLVRDVGVVHWVMSSRVTGFGAQVFWLGIAVLGLVALVGDVRALT